VDGGRGLLLLLCSGWMLCVAVECFSLPLSLAHPWVGFASSSYEENTTLLIDFLFFSFNYSSRSNPGLNIILAGENQPNVFFVYKPRTLTHFVIPDI